MQTLFTNLDSLIAAGLSLLGLLLYTPATRYFTYGILLLALTIELMPTSVNLIALLCCTTSLLTLMTQDGWSHYHVRKRKAKLH